MGKNKKKKPEIVEAGSAHKVTPWNALFRLPEKQKYRAFAFLVWLLGMFIILWVFRN
jgi:hypothetical protein